MPVYERINRAGERTMNTRQSIRSVGAWLKVADTCELVWEGRVIASKTCTSGEECRAFIRFACAEAKRLYATQ
jgi:hypothetical protein